VVGVGRVVVAVQQGEVGFGAALAVDVHAVADGFVPADLHAAAGLVGARQGGLGGGEVGGVLGADDAEELAEGGGVGGVGFDALDQGAGAFLGGGAVGVLVGHGLGGGGGGAVHGGDAGVHGGVVGGGGGDVAGGHADGGAVGGHDGSELVVPEREGLRARRHVILSNDQELLSAPRRIIDAGRVSRRRLMVG